VKQIPAISCHEHLNDMTGLFVIFVDNDVSGYIDGLHSWRW